jgi:hypothetical protein
VITFAIVTATGTPGQDLYIDLRANSCRNFDGTARIEAKGHVK